MTERDFFQRMFNLQVRPKHLTNLPDFKNTYSDDVIYYVL